MKTVIYTDEYKDEIALLALRGIPVQEIVRKYGVSYMSVVNWEKRYLEKHGSDPDAVRSRSELPDIPCNLNKKWNYHTRLKELRLERFLSQTEVGRAVGLHQTAYARYERGEIELPIRYLRKLCKYYDVSADYMLMQTDKRKYKKKVVQ